jgi:PAS domain S-box-containing protein
MFATTRARLCAPTRPPARLETQTPMSDTPPVLRRDGLDPALANHPAIMLLIDAGSGRIVDANQSARDFYGYPGQTLLQRRISDLNILVPDRVHECMRQALESECGEFIFRHRLASGQLRDVKVRSGPVDEENGLLLSVVEDVTNMCRDRGQAAHLAAAVENIHEAVFITNPGGMLTYVNPAFCRLSGFAVPELLGRNICEICPLDSTEECHACRRNVALGRGCINRVRRQRKDGTEYLAEVSLSPLPDAAGNMAGVVGVERDVTEADRVRRHRRASQRLESLGTMAGGIAHDFNNILGAITGFTEMARAEVESDAVRRDLEEVLRAASRAKDIVRQILAFTRGGDRAGLAPLLPVPVVKETLKLVRSSLPTSVALETGIASTSDYILARPDQIQQILVNLCNNAAKAMAGQDSGLLKVALETVTHNASSPSSPPREPDMLRLTVEDNGHGMEPETQELMFDPFFTTDANGTGMGLSVVHGIVQGLGGQIEVTSRPGQGTRVDVHLGLHKVEPETEASESRPVCRTPGRVLLVDDETPLLVMMEKMLTRAGHRVLAHADPAEALEAVRRDPGACDLAVVDETMPGMSGTVLAGKVKELAPDLEIVLCTGYGEDLAAGKLRRAGIAEVVLKPFTMSELTRVVQRRLDSLRPSSPAASGPEPGAGTAAGSTDNTNQ